MYVHPEDLVRGYASCGPNQRLVMQPSRLAILALNEAVRQQQLLTRTHATKYVQLEPNKAKYADRASKVALQVDLSL